MSAAPPRGGRSILIVGRGGGWRSPAIGGGVYVLRGTPDATADSPQCPRTTARDPAKATTAATSSNTAATTHGDDTRGHPEARAPWSPRRCRCASRSPPKWPMYGSSTRSSAPRPGPFTPAARRQAGEPARHRTRVLRPRRSTSPVGQDGTTTVVSVAGRGSDPASPAESPSPAISRNPFGK